MSHDPPNKFPPWRAVLAVGVCAMALAAQSALAAPPGAPQSLLSLLAVGQATDDCFPPLVAGQARYRGSRTCQSAACHGSLEPKTGGKVRRNEYTIWRDKDPHAKAYSNISLDNQRSREMLERLGIAKNKKIVDRTGYENCQKCHSLGVGLKSPEGIDLVEGVSCEACHGPSDKWYDKHFKTAGFEPKKAAADGMIDTEDVFVRARLCVQCHVGGADREVNHDLLAAGHPQLRFELAAFLHLVPKHWNDAGERKAAGKELFELQLWAAGQVAAADASLALLEARASRAVKSPRAWPELAESNCFGCHHDLSSPSWRQQRGFDSRPLGNPPWGSWYFSLLDHVAEKDGGAPSAAQFRKALAQLKKTMESRISPDPELVVTQAKAARTALCQWAKPDGALVAATARPARLREVFATYSADPGDGTAPGKAAVEDWDVATQLYLAVTAVHEANKDENKRQGRPESLDDKVVADWIKQLRADLAFSAGYDSPREFVGLVEKAGTKTSQREKVRSALLQVFQQLKRRGDK